MDDKLVADVPGIQPGYVVTVEAGNEYGFSDPIQASALISIAITSPEEDAVLVEEEVVTISGTSTGGSVDLEFTVDNEIWVPIDTVLAPGGTFTYEWTAVPLAIAIRAKTEGVADTVSVTTVPQSSPVITFVSVPDATVGQDYTAEVSITDADGDLIPPLAADATLNDVAADSVSNVDDVYSFTWLAASLPVAGTGYVLAVVADDEGNRHASETTTVDVVAADVEAPAGIADLVATAGDTEVSLVWTYPADADLAVARIYRGEATGFTRDGTTLIETVNSPTPGSAGSYTDTGLTNGTPYYYVIECDDEVPNTSASNEATATPVQSITTLSYTYNVAPATFTKHTTDDIYTHDAGEAPDGSMTADWFAVGPTSIDHRIKTGNLQTSQTADRNTFTVLVKPSGYDYVSVELTYGKVATFNLATEQVVATLGVDAAVITPAANGYYLLDVSFTTTPGETFPKLYIYVHPTENPKQFITGDGTQGIFIAEVSHA